MGKAIAKRTIFCLVSLKDTAAYFTAAAATPSLTAAQLINSTGSIRL